MLGSAGTSSKTVPVTTPTADEAKASPKSIPDHAVDSTPPQKKTKLSYKDQRELDALPSKIESLEVRHAELLGLIAQPGFYEQPPDDVAAALTAVTESEQALDRALERMVELEG
jgi:ATP-binding cassette subfamily F protein uup